MTNPIITVTELNNRLKKHKSYTVVIDCRFSLADTDLGENQYHKGHIPGAYYFHLDRDLSGKKQVHGGRHPLPDPKQLSVKLGNAGVNTQTPVVVYDDSRFGFAARAWWILNYLGHSNVSVLDGGYKAWRDAGLPIDRRTPPTKAGKFKPRVNSDWTLDVTDIQESLKSNKPNYTLIDSREAKRYQGLEEPIDPIAGHIPGALNFPWQDVSNEQGFFNTADVQKARWQPVKDHPLVIYCGSGVTACVNLLSLAAADIPARLYPGSWSDWCSYPDTPIQQDTPIQKDTPIPLATDTADLTREQ